MRLFGLSLVIFVCAIAVLAQQPPKEWIDPDTGHRVVRLTDEPGSQSLYFHQNPYTASGDKMVFTSPTGLHTYNFKTGKSELLVEGRVGSLIVGPKTRQAFYFKGDSIYATNLDTRETRLILTRAELRTGSGFGLNADETLLGGSYVEGGQQFTNPAPPAPGQPRDNYPGKGEMMERRLAAKLPMALYTVNVKTGEVKSIYRSTDWLNHVQFSPSDPKLMMYCHEGPWHKVDRIWSINIDEGKPRLMHKRTMDMEIAGHEFFGPHDMIWYDLQTPKSQVFWLAGVNVKTGKTTRYSVPRAEWSVHFNVSPDGQLFAGDGGGPNSVAAPGNGQWIYLFRPAGGGFKTEKLVNLAKHNYGLEPNVTFTPDQKWIVFRSNMLGPTYVFAVEVKPQITPMSTGLTLPDVISSGMVLQQDQAVPIWGKADPGESVTVRFKGQVRSSTADASGRWTIRLRPMKATATPAVLIVEGKNKIELQDVLVGEVWLVAGQSNMQRLLSETANGADAIAAANHPAIRLFNVSRQVAFKHAQPPLGIWKACSPKSVKEFSAAGYYFGVELQKELNVPIGLINSSYGGSQAEAWTPVEYLTASADLKPTVDRTKIWDEERPRVKVQYDEAIRQWREEADKAKAAGAVPRPSPAVPDSLREYRVAASIYNGMIEPLIPFSIRGAIWYQGESNEARAQQYGILLPVMIKSWRERWGEGDFPFGIVQLPNYREAKTDPADEAWSHVREAQRLTAASVPRTGLIVTIDIGEARDIHPKNKLDVGKRMARWALVDVYKQKIVKSGPVFQKAEIKNSNIVVTFSEVGSGLKLRSGSKPEEFAIAGSDHKWYWAEAKIVGRNRVEVWSPQVSQPVAVRYAFNNNPRNPNLTNDTGIPAGPFRTDNWPGPTDGKR